MSETLAQYLVDTLGGTFSEELIAFIVSMLPVLELKDCFYLLYKVSIDKMQMKYYQFQIPFTPPQFPNDRLCRNRYDGVGYLHF